MNLLLICVFAAPAQFPTPPQVMLPVTVQPPPCVECGYGCSCYPACDCGDKTKAKVKPQPVQQEVVYEQSYRQQSYSQPTYVQQEYTAPVVQYVQPVQRLEYKPAPVQQSSGMSRSIQPTIQQIRPVNTFVPTPSFNNQIQQPRFVQQTPPVQNYYQPQYQQPQTVCGPNGCYTVGARRR